MSTEFQDYLRKILPTQALWVKEMEAIAAERGIPIMDPASIQLLKQIVQMMQPKLILEIGTAIGYSALQMHDAFPSSKILTIERDHDLYCESLKYIKQQKKEAYIEVLYGDAHEKLVDLRESAKSYDLIFIDAAKAQYKRFFKAAHPLLAKGGLIITDNVLFREKVYKPEDMKTRLQKLANKIHDYNEWLMKREDYVTTIIPVGDGISLSYKK